MPSELQYGDLRIVVLAEAYNPTILNPDWLERREVVKEDWGWELSRPPICTPAVSTVSYGSGVSIQVRPEKAIFTEVRAGAMPDQTRMPEIAARYFLRLPEVSYKAVGINPNIHVPMLTDEDAAGYIARRYVANGRWRQYGDGPARSAVTLRFDEAGAQTLVTIQAARYGPDPEEREPVVLFAGNVHRGLKGEDIDARHSHLISILEQWKADCNRFRELVEEILLAEE